MASCISRAASVSSFTEGTPASAAVASAVTTPTTLATAAVTPMMMLTPGIDADRRVDAAAATFAATEYPVRARVTPPITTLAAATPLTMPGLSWTNLSMPEKTSVPISYRLRISGMNCSPMVVFSASHADFIRVSWPFMLSSLTFAMRWAAPVQLLILLVREV